MEMTSLTSIAVSRFRVEYSELKTGRRSKHVVHARRTELIPYERPGSSPLLPPKRPVTSITYGC